MDHIKSEFKLLGAQVPVDTAVYDDIGVSF